jgi:hypothetical protein
MGMTEVMTLVEKDSWKKYHDKAIVKMGDEAYRRREMSL